MSTSIYTPTHLGPIRTDWDGPRSDAEPTDGLVTLVPGSSELPAACSHCGSAWLGVEQPLGPHARGRVWCETCSRQLCWLAGPLRSPVGSRQKAVGSGQQAVGAQPREYRPTDDISGQESPAPLPTAYRLPPTGSAAISADWRGPGCGDRCVRLEAPLMGSRSEAFEVIEAHDPDAHEAYVHRLLTPTVVRTGPLVVNLDRGATWVDGAAVSISGALWTVLSYLAAHLDRIVSAVELVEAIDPALVDATSENYVSTMLFHLRQRLGAAGRLIETRRRVGYMLRAEPF